MRPFPAAALPLPAILCYVLVTLAGAQAQTTPDQPEGRPKYQRALTDLVPANLITVLDKYHRPITNNYVPEPTKQKLTKAEILARFTTQRTTPSTTTSTTTTTTTTSTTTTRKPSTFVTSFPGATSLSTDKEGVTEPPFRILFIQTTTPSAPSSSGETEVTTPAFFSHIVTQTAKTVTVIEDGQEKSETAGSSSSSTGQSTTAAPQVASTNPVNFSPVFIYKNHRFTSDSPKPVVNVATTVTSSDGEVVKAQTVPVQQQQAEEKSTTKPSRIVSTARPRRKVIKVKSRKAKKEEKQAKEAKDDKATTVTVPATEVTTKAVKPTDKTEEIKEPTIVKETKAQPLEKEKPKGLNRRLNIPQRTKPTGRPATTPVRSTTPVPSSETETTSSRIRRPGGLRRLAVDVKNANRVLTKEPEKPTTTTQAPTTAARSTLRPLFRTRVAATPTRATVVPAPTSATTAVPLFEPTKAPAVRRLPQSTVTRPASATTRAASTTKGTTIVSETPTILPQTSTSAKHEVLAKTVAPRLPSRRVVTRIGTSRPVTTLTSTTPIPETPTIAPLSAAYSTPTKSSDSTASTEAQSKVRKVVKRKRKPTPPPSSPTVPRTTVTPVSIVYFQTTTATTPEPPLSTFDASRRTVKRRRKKQPSPAGIVSTQTLPISFSPTEPSTFSAPAAVTGFRPISTSSAANFFGSPSPDAHHLESLPKTDEISQVINLPGGRLSSYQARYAPQPRQHVVDSQTLLPERDFAPLSAGNPTLGQPFSPRLAPHQRAIRPGPSFGPGTVDFYGTPGVGDQASYQDLQRLLVAENNRFFNQQRNSARYTGFQAPLDY